jgi:hypothetical protein
VLADFRFTFDGHTYDVITSGLTWEDASTAARNRSINGVPGNLAQIDSDEENNKILSQLSNNIRPSDFDKTTAPDGGGALYIWIGANDRETEGEWSWDGSGERFWQGSSSGSAVDGRYNNWGNEPDDFEGQDTAGIALSDWPSGIAGQWNDLDAENLLYYIVEYATDTAVFSINAGLNDAWFNPATNGQGFFIAVFPEIELMALAWFTYDTERPQGDVTAMLGEPGHRWLVAQGAYDGDTANLTIFVTEGGVFDAVEPVPSTDQAGDGTLTLEFADCTEGLIKYEITSLGISGEIPIQRISDDNVALCEVLAASSAAACERPQIDISHGRNDPQITNNAIVPSSSILDGGPGPDGIPPLESPKFLQTSFYNSGDLVVGVKVGDDIRAYPHNILNWHEVVNEQFTSGEFATLSYCPLTGSSVLWKAFMEPSNKTYGTSGQIFNSNLIMYDRATESYWSQMLEQSISGSEVTRIPDRLQVVETTWATWKAMYPTTLLLSEDTGFTRDYFEFPYGSYKESEGLLYPVNNSEDDRLHRKRRVLGINVGTSSKVYPITNFANNVEVINESVGDMQVVTAGSNDLNFGVVYNRVMEDCTLLNFKAVQDALPVVMRDNEGNEWDVFGTAVSGARTGQKLQKTNSYIAYWFAWTAFFPGADIHQ